MDHVFIALGSSLATSCFAVFIATLGNLWLDRFALVETRGSIIDRGLDQQCKMDGLVVWHFDFIMRLPTFLLEAAFLLLSYALLTYPFGNKITSSVITGFTTSTLLFYLFFTSAAALSYNCPFQTSPSLILHWLIRFRNKDKKCPKQSKWFGHIFPQKPRPNSGGPHSPVRSSTSDVEYLGNQIELSKTNQPSPLFNRKVNWDHHVLASNSITWMFEVSIDTEFIADFVTEIVWHTGIQTTPLERLYNTILKCFDHSSECPGVIPKLRNKAYLSAKALFHLAIQRKCISDGPDEAIFKSILNRHLIMGSKHYEGDSDLESTLGFIDHTFGVFKPMQWQNFSFTLPHLTWMGHILLYHAWDVLGKNEPLPNNIEKFILHSLQLEPPPPKPIVADCLFMIGLVLGINLHINDLMVIDKR